MEIIVTDSYEQSCRQAADRIAAVVRQNPAAKLGLATGGTPLPVYRRLIELCKAGKLDFSAVRTVNLDEYRGLAPDHPQSYRYFMDHNLFDHINIKKENTFVASGLGDADKSAEELHRKVYEGGVPAIQLLGIGGNGHIAFNEAGETLRADSHTEQLSEATIEANARFFESLSEVPTEAISMGMGEILAAESLLLLATGESKAAAVRGLVQGDEITTRNPATFLKLHPRAAVMIDKALAALCGLA